VKAIREHFWKNYIKKLFEEKILRGNIEHLCGILDRDHFEINFKNIRKVDEEKTCTVVFTLIDYDLNLTCRYLWYVGTGIYMGFGEK
jgi:hypothetical protein